IGRAGAVQRHDARVSEHGRRSRRLVEGFLGARPRLGRTRHHFQRDGLVVLEVPRHVEARDRTAGVEDLEPEELTEVLLHGGVDRVAARLLRGGHGSGIASTVNRSLVAPTLTPVALTTSEYPTPGTSIVRSPKLATPATAAT